MQKKKERDIGVMKREEAQESGEAMSSTHIDE